MKQRDFWKQRCLFLAVSAVVLAAVILFTGAVKPVREVRLAPEMEELISEEGEAAFYSFFDGLQVWYAAHPQTPGGVTLTMDRDYNQLFYIMQDGGIYMEAVEAARETAPFSVREWANSYNTDMALFLCSIPVGFMMGLAQNGTVELSRDTWAVLGETIDALVDRYQG